MKRETFLDICGGLALFAFAYIVGIVIMAIFP